jgi:hypothetical protein
MNIVLGEFRFCLPKKETLSVLTLVGPQGKKKLGASSAKSS